MANPIKKEDMAVQMPIRTWRRARVRTREVSSNILKAAVFTITILAHEHELEASWLRPYEQIDRIDTPCFYTSVVVLTVCGGLSVSA